MTPRKASVRVAHQISCANRNQTSMASLKGCTCPAAPSYYTFHRDRAGVSIKGARYKDKRFVQRLATEIQNDINKNRAGWEEEKNLDFPDWADEYLRILEGDVARGRRARSTKDTYERSLLIARDAIGWVPVRSISDVELRKYDDAMGSVTDATRRKHLAHLSACLGEAVSHRYAERNPVRLFLKRLDLRVPQGTPPFEPGELERLLAQLAKEAPVYSAIAKAAALTGARVGELVALDWSDVDLGAGRIEIRHTYDPDYGLTRPKDKDARTIYLIPEAQALLEAWVASQGVQTTGQVFPAPRDGGYVNAGYLRKVIGRAMTDAGIVKLHPRTRRPRKPLHSLRATFATQMIVEGRNPHWVEQQMGHSDLKLTMQVYGGWSDEQMRAEAQGAEVQTA